MNNKPKTPELLSDNKPKSTPQALLKPNPVGLQVKTRVKMRRPKAFNFNKTVKFVSPQQQKHTVDVSVGKTKDTDVWMHLRAINVKLIKKE